MIGYLDKNKRPLVLIMSEMSGHVKTLKVEDRDQIKIKKLMSFSIDDKKLLQKYKAIWTKIKDFQNINLNALSIYDDRHIKKNMNIWR